MADDVRTFLRRTARRPWQAIGPVLVIACGVAGSSAIFSVLHGLLIRPLPFPSEERLVAMYAVEPEQPGIRGSKRFMLPWRTWEALDASPAFDGVGAWARSRMVFGRPGQDVVETWHVSASLLRVLGVRPVTGRLFTSQEDHSRTTGSALLSEDCWQRRFGGDPDIVGKTIVVTLFVGSPEVKTIIGVITPSLKLRGFEPEVILPLGERISWSTLDYGTLNVIGRLSVSSSVEQAADVVRASLPTQEKQASQTDVHVVPLRQHLLSRAGPPPWLLFSTATTVLLVACASVAGLSLSDAQARKRETAVRLALGASAATVVRQLATEQVIKALAAASASLVLTFWLVRLVGSVTPAELLQTMSLEVSGGVLLFCTVSGALTIVIFGIGPALVMLETGSNDALGGAAGHTTSIAGVAHRLIVAAQLSLSFVLITSATLLWSIVNHFSTTPLGFDPAHLIVVSIKTTAVPRMIRQPGQLPAFSTWRHTEDLLLSLRRVHGVTNAAGVGDVPFGGIIRTMLVRRSDDPGGAEFEAQVQTITSSYFRTMRMQFIDGRDLTPEDRLSEVQPHELKVVITDDLAKQAGIDAIGRGLIDSTRGKTIYKVVGIVKSTRHRHTAEALPTIYMLAPTFETINSLVIRAEDATALVPTIRQVITEFDASTLVTKVMAMDALLDGAIAKERFLSRFTIVFGAAALLLAVCGVFALGARLVWSRQKEYGIRVALGATGRHIASLLVRDAILVIVVAVVSGFPFAIIAAHSLRALVVGVAAPTWGVLLIGFLILASAALISMVQPVRYALSLDPAASLRV